MKLTKLLSLRYSLYLCCCTVSTSRTRFGLKSSSNKPYSYRRPRIVALYALLHTTQTPLLQGNSIPNCCSLSLAFHLDTRAITPAINRFKKCYSCLSLQYLHSLRTPCYYQDYPQKIRNRSHKQYTGAPRFLSQTRSPSRSQCIWGWCWCRWCWALQYLLFIILKLFGGCRSIDLKLPSAARAFWGYLK